uniref:NADH dehydrogenase subunit 6 n=1 Tax=Odontella aurita TaxID=265563 RepID=UPI002028999B|nr:NADH dehydrogenase subunit 6 [Odontella aurita]QYB22927.1 NADH dehydrogenase subunit 6 [Odontella aurita]
MIINSLFYIFSFILLMSSIMVISVQNTIYSVLFLVLSFISSTSLLCLMECEFIALIFIIIYVGAIAVLFLFVVMMLDIKTVSVTKDSLKYFPFGCFLGILFLWEIVLVILKTFKSNPYSHSFLSNIYVNWFDKLDSFTELQTFGQLLYTYYILQFLVAGIILLLSVVGAVVLTLNMVKYKKAVKTQVIFKQLSRTFKNSLIY